MVKALDVINAIAMLTAYSISFLYLKSLVNSKISEKEKRNKYIKPIRERLPFLLVPFFGTASFLINLPARPFSLSGFPFTMFVFKGISLLISFVLFFIVLPSVKIYYRRIKNYGTI